MSGISKKLMGTTAAAGGVAIEDVFSTYIFDGDSDGVTISNGIDLAGEGGLVWNKDRTASYGQGHVLIDTERGPNKILATELDDAEITSANAITFNSDGYSCTAGVSSPTGVFNASGFNIASWTFRKAPRFFDVVTYTGDGVVGRAISHNLGIEPGCIIVKRADATGDWQVYHRSNTAAPETDYLVLNSTAATVDSNTRWNDTAPTDSAFTVGTEATVNASGGTYVAYLFAHDPLGESGDGSDGLIACGSYTGNGSADGPEIDLGWEPQWVMIKRSNGTSNWWIADSMRGFTVGGTDARLYANLSNDENNIFDYIEPTATGFKLTTSVSGYNGSGDEVIYIAIRRGPMRQPTSGTEVFAAQATRDATDGTSATNAFTSGFPIDFIIHGARGGGDQLALDRLRGNTYLITNTGDAEVSWIARFDSMDGLPFTVSQSANSNFCAWMFRRAPGFFDVVAYTGTGSATTISHNLGVEPELIIVKNRDQSDAWQVYAGDETDYLVLNANAVTADNVDRWNDTAPTASVFTIGTAVEVNTSTENYIAYLFATLLGVSKVGSYTGNGSSQTIDCAFTSGARFILIKRTDSTGDWYVWDTERGIVAGDDPFLELNTTDAEVTTDDSIDPDSSGFIVNQTATTNINVSSGEYIFLAIA